MVCSGIQPALGGAIILKQPPPQRLEAMHERR
jgi:hypothetical protein